MDVISTYKYFCKYFDVITSFLLMGLNMVGERLTNKNWSKTETSVSRIIN